MVKPTNFYMNLNVLNVVVYFIAIVLVSLICLLLSFMLYLHYLHIINRHLPGPPRSSFIFGNLPQLWQYKKTTGRNLCEFVLKTRLEYGPIFLMFYLHRPVVYLGDPGYVREVFINNHKYLIKPKILYLKSAFIFGERGMGYGLVTNTSELLWRKRRHVMNPAFHRKRLKNVMTNFNEVCSRFITHLDKVVDNGKPTSMVDEFGKVTLAALTQVLFNVETNIIEDPETPFPLAIRNFLKGIQANLDIPLPASFLKIFQFRPFRSATQNIQINAARFLRKFASECITARLKDITEEKQVPDDLLSLLINDGSLTREEIIDEMITMFVAGHETTANSLAFALFEIISNSHVEAKLLNEIEEVLGKSEEVTYDHLAKLVYIGQIFDESQRKCPVVPAPARSLQREITVGGYKIPKGNGVTSFTFLFSKNPEFWPEPEIFDPERFCDVGNIPNLSMMHFPFSIGPRNCIGQTFAKFEFKVILAKLFQNFKFKLLPNQTNRMELRLTATPQDGVMCEVSRRSGRY